jgi:hypothetical protein
MALKSRPAFVNRVFYLIMTFLLGALAGCAEVQVRTLPPPPPTPKIRVFVQAITEPGKWKMPEEVFAKRVPKCVEQVLVETGIYELASIEDSKSVLVGTRPLTRWEWAKKDWELARRVGRGLHADYAIIVSRSMVKGQIFWEMTFLNVATGKKYRSVSRTSFQRYLDVEDYVNIFRIKYREIFREAKNDMLATAIQKSHVAPLITAVQPAPGPPPPPPSPAPSSSRVTAPPMEEKPLAATPKEIKEIKEAKASPPTPAPPPPQISSPAVKEEPLPSVAEEIGEGPEDLAGVTVLDLEKVLTAESKPDSRKRLAVYDLETIESLKVVGLILSEALREELIRLGHFALVNRENLVQVLKEIELQMTGLVDEKQAVKVGKGLAASQIVMGRYGALGKSAILQAKRIDVESQGTLAMGSLKCSQGQEDELLAQMSELARKLAGAN